MESYSNENYLNNQSKLDIIALIVSIISFCTCSSCIIGAVIGIALSMIVICDNTGRFANKTKAYIGLGLSTLSIIIFVIFIIITKNSMPNVTDEPLDDAKQRVQDVKEGIQITEEYEFNDEVEKGCIIRTNPESSKLLSEGDTVTLYVSRGKAIIIPDCINKNRDDITTELNSLGLIINETTEYSEDIEKGNVIRTTPTCNEEVESGSTIDVVISSGSKYREIPSYEDKSYMEYAQTLSDLGLQFSAEYDYSDDIDVGYIMECSHSIGEVVDINDNIQLTVSKGPDLTGKNIDTAKNILETMGIEYSISDEFSKEPIGTVINSDISGENSGNTYIIKLSVSKGTKKQAFENECTTASYDDLIRNPEMYKATKIKLKVHVTNIENDTFLGYKYGETIYATYEGNEIVINDGRSVQEPKLRSGDTVTIYGYGDGNGTINVKQKEYQGSLVLGFSYNKTVDSYDIPIVKAEYIEF